MGRSAVPDWGGVLTHHHEIVFDLRVFIKDQPQQEEQETMRPKDTEFAAQLEIWIQTYFGPVMVNSGEVKFPAVCVF